MVEKVVDGVTFYCFDDCDIESRRAFEKAMTGDSVINEMMMALIEAASEIAARKREAWESAKRLLPEEYREEEVELEYNWMLRGFRTNSRGRKDSTSTPQTSR
jgi:hypothetical protein